MIKSINYYCGNMILGYRFVINKQLSNKNKHLISVNNFNNKNNTFKCKTKIMKRNFLGK